MKANEFVKEHGLQYTKSILEQFPKHTHVTNDGRMFISEKDYVEFAPHFKSSLSDAVKISDLKRLVESYELVEQYNGLFEAKELIRVSPKLTSELRELAAAIADVESCQ